MVQESVRVWGFHCIMFNISKVQILNQQKLAVVVLPYMQITIHSLFSFRNASIIALGALRFETMFKEMAMFATSRAWQLGRAIYRALKMNKSAMDAIVQHQQGFVLITGKVSDFYNEWIASFPSIFGGAW